ncbi:MAG: hypothetical protein HFH41_04765 [Lachnospiraceae bacterium]|nr:hypothetical protein [Lachnospiraceae bacterium]
MKKITGRIKALLIEKVKPKTDFAIGRIRKRRKILKKRLDEMGDFSRGCLIIFSSFLGIVFLNFLATILE